MTAAEKLKHDFNGIEQLVNYMHISVVFEDCKSFPFYEVIYQYMRFESDDSHRHALQELILETMDTAMVCRFYRHKSYDRIARNIIKSNIKNEFEKFYRDLHMEALDIFKRNRNMFASEYRRFECQILMDHEENNSLNSALTEPIYLRSKNRDRIKELESLHGAFKLYENSNCESSYNKWEVLIEGARDNIVYDFDPIIKLLSNTSYYYEQKLEESLRILAQM